jgi:hypothetical protein
MSPQRVLCPTSASWHGKHYATDRRWTIATPEGAETVLCSAACTLSWLVYGLPADTSAPAPGQRDPAPGHPGALRRGDAPGPRPDGAGAPEEIGGDPDSRERDEQGLHGSASPLWRPTLRQRDGAGGRDGEAA